MQLTFRRSFRFARAVPVLLAIAGCGGADAVETPGAFGRPDSPYTTACTALAQSHATEVAEKRYLPVELLVHEWPLGDAATRGSQAFLSEDRLVADLREPPVAGKPAVRTLLVLARGGIGKSKLAEALTARLCADQPVLRIDLALDIAPMLDKPAGQQNQVAVHAAHELGLDLSAGAEAALRKSLGNKPLLLVLDSLDEVPLLQRQAVVAQVDDMVTRVLPTARAVVMTRPPVFSSNYGLQTVSGRLELQQLTCEETDAALGRNVPDEAERKAVAAFVQRYGLDRKVEAFDRCYYPHMSTYRDLQVVHRLARNTMADQKNPDLEDFRNSRAQVYTYFLTAQLLKDLKDLPLLPKDALATVDAMVAARNPGSGDRNLPFSLQDCVAVVPLAEAGAKQASCERLLQSALFKQGAEPGVFHFDNQSLGDLFLARWTAASLAKDGAVDCTGIAKKADLLESNEIAGFLVGQENGQKCFAQIALELCRRGGYARHVFEQLDQGLPAGPERAQLLAEVAKDLEAMRSDLCVSGLLEGLGRGLEIPAAAPPAPVPVEADKPAKGKKKPPAAGKTKTGGK